MSAPGAAPITGLDIERVRADFPILGQLISGRPLAYLDNGASTQKPASVIDSISGFYRNDYANVHRGIHTLSQRATDRFEASRQVVADFLGAGSRDEIVYTRGTTESINLVAQSYGRDKLGPGDEVLVSEMEHHSNIVPWQMVCEQTGADLRVIPITDSGELDMEAFHARLSKSTRMVAITHVSNALGTIVPLDEVISASHAVGAVVLVDGAQAVAHMAVDVSAMGCDFYAFSSHKVFGPTGMGVLYARHDLLEKMPPWQGGGDMISSVSFEKTTYNRVPYKFEAGTPHIAGAVGLASALEYVNSLGADRITEHEDQLLAYATEQMLAIPGIRIIGTATNKAGILSFQLEGAHASDVGTLLDQQGVAIRVGHHCAMPVMTRFGVTSTCRASLAVYNNEADVDALVSAVVRARELLVR